MPIAPQKFREIVFQLIYSDDFGADADVVEMLMAQLSVTKRIVREASSIRDAILAKKKEIDDLIQVHSESYELDRIPRVERNVIRLAAYELLFSKEVPPKVAIAEAIRLARKFATPEAATFVNAILDAILKQHLAEPTDVSTLSGASV
jgi:transcription antitermination protein NusB